MKLCVIPARGGSKRIPRKNIRPFCGRPMLAWSIETARTSDCFDRVVVSTDDPEIAELARCWGAETPFMRPAALADDHTGTTAVIVHAIDWFAAQGEAADPVCCLYATAPFVEAADLRRGAECLAASDAAFVFAAAAYPSPIQRAFRINAAGRCEMFHPEYFHCRSQDLEPAWHDAGQFYWGRAQAWRAGLAIFGEHSIPLIVPRHRVEDIDTPEDWLRAELLFEALRLRQRAQS